MSATGPEVAAGRSGTEAPTWHRYWESSLDASWTPALADLLLRSYPNSGAFDGTRSWAGARPELRVVGFSGDTPIAHAGIVRRFLRSPVDDTSTLVGDVGLVAVHPDHRHGRLGVALMNEVASTLLDLRVPYGFLTCGPGVRTFYERCGWSALADHPVHSITIRHHLERDRHHGMLLPVLEPLDAWPDGPIHRDGQEI